MVIYSIYQHTISRYLSATVALLSFFFLNMNQLSISLLVAECNFVKVFYFAPKISFSHLHVNYLQFFLIRFHLCPSNSLHYVACYLYIYNNKVTKEAWKSFSRFGRDQTTQDHHRATDDGVYEFIKMALSKSPISHFVKLQALMRICNSSANPVPSKSLLIDQHRDTVIY